MKPVIAGFFLVHTMSRYGKSRRDRQMSADGVTLTSEKQRPELISQLGGRNMKSGRRYKT